MRILSIETSCDETAVSLVEATGDFPSATYNVLGNGLLSQIDIHREFGGVVPKVAKREHAKALVPMLAKALGETEAKQSETAHNPLDAALKTELETLFEREPGLATALITFAETHKKPDIDIVAVTSGPGLEPALWVGINFARALSMVWGIPVVPINHMEGHILSSVFHEDQLSEVVFPALALLISGGHTELVLMRAFGEYEVVGSTRDDAVGEAFDKAARMMGLPYPGGPEISKLAAYAREHSLEALDEPLPRPMLHSNDLDFSFSGLKTAVRNKVLDTDITDDERAQISRDFEDAVTDVLLKKTTDAIDRYGVRTLILGGGVTANTYIRESFTKAIEKRYTNEVTLRLPDQSLSTDNAIMIALSGHMHASEAGTDITINANGKWSL